MRESVVLCHNFSPQNDAHGSQVLNALHRASLTAHDWGKCDHQSKLSGVCFFNQLFFILPPQVNFIDDSLKSTSRPQCWYFELSEDVSRKMMSLSRSSLREISLLLLYGFQTNKQPLFFFPTSCPKNPPNEDKNLKRKVTASFLKIFASMLHCSDAGLYFVLYSSVPSQKPLLSKNEWSLLQMDASNKSSRSRECFFPLWCRITVRLLDQK